MPLNKNAFIRYRIIDACLRDKQHRYPSKNYIISKCEERLGVKISSSTFEKDIQVMRFHSEPGFYAPILFDRYHNGYYYTDENYSITKFALKEEDIDAIEFAAAILQQFRNVPILKNYAAAINRIMSIVNVRRILEPTQFCRFIQLEQPVSFKGDEYIEVIVRAIKDREALSIKYKAFQSDKNTSHILHPYLLKEYRNRWYVIGMNNRYKELRTYGLDRINAISKEPAIKYTDCGFDVDEYYKNTIGISVTREKPVKISLRFKKEQAQYIITQPIHSIQIVEKISERYVFISIKIIPAYEFVSMILGWGSDVKVLSPASLRKQIMSTLEGNLKQYGNNKK